MASKSNQSSARKRAELRQSWNSLSAGTQRLATFIGACGVITGLITGCVGVICNRVNDTIHDITDPIKVESETSDREMLMSLMRVELMILMQHYPNNVVEIEETAESYFEAGGNHYMKALYNDWCQEYDPDGCHIMLKAK